MVHGTGSHKKTAWNEARCRTIPKTGELEIFRHRQDANPAHRGEEPGPTAFQAQNVADEGCHMTKNVRPDDSSFADVNPMQPAPAAFVRARCPGRLPELILLAANCMLV